MPKAKELKVYGGCYDGRRHFIVAAYTQKEAWEAMCKCKAFYGSITTWKKSTSVSGNAESVRVSTMRPGTVFQVLNPYTKAKTYEALT